MPQAPRQKAKKGIFGPGGLNPLLTIINAPTAAVNAVAEAGYEASASDTEDGDISASITWTSDLDGLLGSGGGPLALTFTTVGTHVLTVEATATTGGATVSDTVTVEVS